MLLKNQLDKQLTWQAMAICVLYSAGKLFCLLVSHPSMQPLSHANHLHFSFVSQMFQLVFLMLFCFFFLFLSAFNDKVILQQCSCSLCHFQIPILNYGRPQHMHGCYVSPSFCLKLSQPFSNGHKLKLVLLQLQTTLLLVLAIKSLNHVLLPQKIVPSMLPLVILCCFTVFMCFTQRLGFLLG